MSKLYTKVVPNQTLICQKVIYDTLKTHPNLTEDDITFGTNFICNLNLSIEKLTAVVLMTCKTTNTGRFALIFNHDLDNALKLQDGKLLVKLLTGDNFLFEVYDSELTKEERAVVERMIAKETIAIQNALKEAGKLISKGNFASTDHLIPCNLEEKEGTLYSQCYKGVCLKEENSDVMNGDTQIPSTIYTVDQVEGERLTNTFCFEFMDLIEGLSMTPPTNPTTKQPFSPLALSLLLPRYGKEVKMYKRYLKQLNMVLNR